MAEEDSEEQKLGLELNETGSFRRLSDRSKQ